MSLNTPFVFTKIDYIELEVNPSTLEFPTALCHLEAGSCFIPILAILADVPRYIPRRATVDCSNLFSHRKRQDHLQARPLETSCFSQTSAKFDNRRPFFSLFPTPPPLISTSLSSLVLRVYFFRHVHSSPQPASCGAQSCHGMILYSPWPNDTIY
jgi:hypothetical protein